jgi:hypothetical protein
MIAIGLPESCDLEMGISDGSGVPNADQTPSMDCYEFDPTFTAGWLSLTHRVVG